MMNKKAEYVSWRDEQFNLFNAGTVFRRQNLPSKDVRFWRLKTIPTPKEFKKKYGRRPIT